MEKYGGEIFNSFECLEGVNPLLYSQLCLYHYAEISKVCNLGVWSICHQTSHDIQYTPVNQLTWLKNVQPSVLKKDRLIDQVTIGNRQQPICSLEIPLLLLWDALTNYHLGPYAWWNKQDIIIYHLALWFTSVWQSQRQGPYPL